LTQRQLRLSNDTSIVSQHMVYVWQQTRLEDTRIQRKLQVEFRLCGLAWGNHTEHMQEYGAECGEPNRNTCYLSYLDSVKYFRPEARRSANDRALRTMVYHEVLLGYMEHAKKLGMNAMYIWSCPPLAVCHSFCAPFCAQYTVWLPVRV
jgi:hypothetical protein